MTTRAAAAATSQRAKQHLVNLLFKSDYGGKGRHAHSKLDFASYSYFDLKAAYLKRVQSIHPDKAGHLNLDLGSEHDDDDNDRALTDSDIPSASASTSTSTSWNENPSWKDVVDATTKSKSKSNDKCNDNRKDASAFIELQEAWTKYEKLSKLMRRGRAATESQMRGVQEDFTAFGVGCSFSDSAEESMRRADIMDQAGKGWCAAGQIDEGDLDTDLNADSHGNVNGGVKIHIPLVGDDLFSDVNDSDGSASTASEGKAGPSRRRSLVDHLVPKFIIR